MTTSTSSAAGIGLPEPEFSLFGRSNHLDATVNLMAALGMAISAVESPYQRDALSRLALKIETRIVAAQECARAHYNQQEAAHERA